MSHLARDFVYQVTVKKDNNKPEPSISYEQLIEYKEDIAKYLERDNKVRL